MKGRTKLRVEVASKDFMIEMLGGIDWMNRCREKFMG